MKSHITSLDEISVELTDGPMVLIFRTLFLGPLLGQKFWSKSLLLCESLHIASSSVGIRVTGHILVALSKLEGNNASSNLSFYTFY